MPGWWGTSIETSTNLQRRGRREGQNGCAGPVIIKDCSPAEIGFCAAGSRSCPHSDNWKAMNFKLVSDYKPRGDQGRAIEQLLRGVYDREQHQVLLGVTGSGKTYTMAKIIEAANRPALVMAHNKTLAAQLYHEFKNFFPHNAVEYFVSYYDYYQPEAYVPAADLYIEKEATINDELDKLRLSATRSLFERRDCIIVASVSCIYGLGSR